MMKRLIESPAARLLTLCGLMLLSNGCTSGRGPLSAWAPWGGKQGPQTPEALAQQRMSSQQSAARKVTAGQQSSLYQPEFEDLSAVPRKEEDLKQPTQLHLTYAKLQEQLGNITEARTSYEKVISREPKSVDAMIGLSRLDALAGRNAEAEARLRQSIEFSQGSAETRFALGQFLASQNRAAEAISEYQAAVYAAPKNKQYQYELGLILARSGQFEKAVQVLAAISSPAEANYNVGYIALQELQRKEVAEACFAKAVELDPELKQAHYWLTQLRPTPSTISTVSGVQTEQKSQVVHAAGIQPGPHDPARYVVPAIQTPTEVPAGLSPEQWEQWKNQAAAQ